MDAENVAHATTMSTCITKCFTPRRNVLNIPTEQHMQIGTGNM